MPALEHLIIEKRVKVGDFMLRFQGRLCMLEHSQELDRGEHRNT